MYGTNYDKAQPPLGQAIAALAVVEEQKRATLHTHAAAWTTLKPDVLQCIAGHEFLTTLAFRIVRSIYNTELPATVHIRHAAVNEIGKFDKLRTAREVPPANVQGKDGIIAFSHVVVCNSGMPCCFHN
jgi:hypothetical protein